MQTSSRPSRFCGRCRPECGRSEAPPFIFAALVLTIQIFRPLGENLKTVVLTVITEPEPCGLPPTSSPGRDENRG